MRAVDVDPSRLGAADKREDFLGRQLQRLAGRWERGHVAAAAFWLGVALSVVVWSVLGRHQWFTRDDWALLLTRERVRIARGAGHMLFEPQDGHWLTVPIVVYRILRGWFGYRTYWPYLLVLLASHLGIVCCVRVICRRLAVSPWTTTLMCGVLLVFGGGWENMLFAVQTSYLLSLLGFLAQVVLTDHQGAVDRRDVLGSVLAVVGVMSSGFGPFFILGIGLFLVLRRRWIAALIAVVPQGLLYAWWWLFWGADPVASRSGRDFRDAPEWALDGLLHTFQAMVSSSWLAGGAAVLAAAMIVWRPVDWQRRSLMIALSATAVVMYLGIAIERSASGLVPPGQSRYVYMAAMLLAPLLALGLDQAARFAPRAILLTYLLLGITLVHNTLDLRANARTWANLSREERRRLSLVAGFDGRNAANADVHFLPNSPDVRLVDIPELVARHAMTPKVPTTPKEIADVHEILGLPPSAQP